MVSKPASKNTAARRSTAALGLLFILAPLLMIGLLGWLFIQNADCSQIPGPGTCTHVLFIGNSYTFYNDLPGTFAKLASAGGHRVTAGMLAQGGWSLEDHENNSATQETLKTKQWDFVVLQEQSQIPADALSRTTFMYPAARALVSEIRAVKAKPIFFQTPAHRSGDPDFGLPDYQTMQSRIDEGYGQIASELAAPVVPVGDAWRLAIQQNPALILWQSDDSHPTEQGTYLSACVFYAIIFNESPEGLRYTGRVDQDTAHALQAVAAQFVPQR